MDFTLNFSGLEVELDNPPTVDGDTKFIFYCSSPSVPKGYDNCAYFFWLNTFFVEKDCQALAENIRHLTEDPKSRRVVENYRTEGDDRLKVLLKREVLDNPHKPKTWNVWGEDFSIEVTFVKPGSGPIRSLSLD